MRLRVIYLWEIMKIFGFILNKIYKKLMSFKASHTTNKTSNEPQKSSSKTENVELNKQELELLLVTIKNSLFKGENIEVLYNLTLKLQESYVNSNKK